MLNSQAVPPTTFTDHYIPPKTRHDVPKSFVRPEDAVVEEVPEPPPPELVPTDAADPDAETIAPGAFLGLAKLKDNADADAKKAKLVDEAGATGPQLPPMPTVAPRPASFLPLLEELSPGLLQSLRSVSNLQVRRNYCCLICGHLRAEL